MKRTQRVLVDWFNQLLSQCYVWYEGLTWLYDSGFGPQVGQVHIGLPSVYNGVGVFTRSVSRGPVCHGHLSENNIEIGSQQYKKKLPQSHGNTWAVERTKDNQLILLHFSPCLWNHFDSRLGYVQSHSLWICRSVGQWWPQPPRCLRTLRSTSWGWSRWCGTVDLLRRSWCKWCLSARSASLTSKCRLQGEFAGQVKWGRGEQTCAEPGHGVESVVTESDGNVTQEEQEEEEANTCWCVSRRSCVPLVRMRLWHSTPLGPHVDEAFPNTVLRPTGSPLLLGKISCDTSCSGAHKWLPWPPLVNCRSPQSICPIFLGIFFIWSVIFVWNVMWKNRSFIFIFPLCIFCLLAKQSWFTNQLLLAGKCTLVALPPTTDHI